jgi:hypothetical protein
MGELRVSFPHWVDESPRYQNHQLGRNQEGRPRPRSSLKEIGSQEEYFFGSYVISNRYFLYLGWWFLQLFVALFQNKFESEFYLAPLKLFTFFKFNSVTLFRDPKEAILTLKMHTESHLWSSKIIPKAVFNNVNLAHFPCNQLEVNKWRASTMQSQRREFWAEFQ